MHHPSKFARVFLLICSTLFAQLAYGSAAEQLSLKLSNIESLGASFVQSTSDRYGELVSVSEGRLVVGTSGRFNITTDTPFEQQLVSDGEDFYTFDPELDQVIVRRLVKDASQIPILVLGNGDPDFLKDYDVTLEEQDNRVSSFTLIATGNSVFDRLQLVFEHALPKRIWFQDSLGQTTEIQLLEVTLNQTVPESDFQFAVPEGVDLIDDR